MSASDPSGLLTLAASEEPDRLAVVCADGRRFTWAELDAETTRVAVGLGAMGVRAGHRVMLATANRVEFVTAYLGTLRAQAVAVPVNPGSTATEFARMVADSGARVVVADGGSITAVRAAMDALEVELGRADGSDLDPGDTDSGPLSGHVRPRLVGVGTTLKPGETSYDQVLSRSGSLPPPLPDPERLAALLYTSGTSGRPRAAMLSARALMANIAQVAATEPPVMTNRDVVLGLLPLFHVYGLNAVLGGVLKHQCKLVLVDRFDPVATLDVIEDEACSVVPVAPPVVTAWLTAEDLPERLSSVRLVLCGAAPLGVEELKAFGERASVALHQGYGLTEASPVVTSTLTTSRAAIARGSVGTVLDGVEIKLRDTAGGRRRADDPGEIWLRGDNLFSGYWPDGRDGPDEDGWWATGDVGYVESGGELFLVDRIKEMVIVSGFNVYPSEVEEVAMQCAGVAEAAAIGVPDPQSGEAVVLYVTPHPDAASDPMRLTEQVAAHCRGQLARFKHPARIEVVEHLPLTPTGKVAKGRLRRSEQSGTSLVDVLG